jgi:hypothetical protein
MERRSIVSALRGTTSQHVLRILDIAKGDYEYTWTPDDAGAVAVAEKEFTAAERRGLVGYQSKDGVDTLTRTFDPDAQTVVLAPRINGG